jgi:ParB family transcriptional regulator, chromosome partitioning protein
MMAEVKCIPISQIHVPPRLREVEEDHAKAIALSMKAHGLINPITVRYAPAKSKGATPYILVAGAHRLQGGTILGWTEIEAAIIDADQSEAQLVEITENLFRNELSALDRAVFVASYKDLWEQVHGPIKTGPKRIRDNNVPNSASPIDEIAKATGSSFTEHLAARLGVHPKAIKRLSQISAHLQPGVRAAVRGTSAADNMSLLLSISKRPPSEQQAIVSTMQAAQLDLPTVLRQIKPAPTKVGLQDATFAALIAAWKKADETTRARFIEHIQEKAAAQ